MDQFNLELPPLRSLDDFLLSSARFQLPNLKDADKWGNRVINNLLYYQTNYYLMSLVVFVLVGFIYPLTILTGAIAVGVGVLLFIYFSASRAAMRFNREHPIISLVCFIAGLAVMVYFFRSLLVLTFSITFPLFLMAIHSSLRLRNLRNKLTNKIEMVGLKKTPMGSFLETLEVLHSSGPGLYDVTKIK